SKQVVRPEFQGAFDSMRTEDAAYTNKVSPYDNDVRRREALTKQLDTYQRGMEMIDEDDPRYQQYLQASLGIMDELASLGSTDTVPASQGTPGGGAPAASSKPSATEANGGLKVE